MSALSKEIMIELATEKAAEIREKLKHITLYGELVDVDSQDQCIVAAYFLGLNEEMARSHKMTSYLGDFIKNRGR